MVERGSASFPRTLLQQGWALAAWVCMRISRARGRHPREHRHCRRAPPLLVGRTRALPEGGVLLAELLVHLQTTTEKLAAQAMLDSRRPPCMLRAARRCCENCRLCYSRPLCSSLLRGCSSSRPRCWHPPCFHKPASLAACLHVAAGLTHHPHGWALHLLSAQRTQHQRVIAGLQAHDSRGRRGSKG